MWKKNIYGKNFKKISKRITFAIYDDKILVSDNIGFVYSINTLDGKVIWVKNHGIPFKSITKVFDNKIFLINQDNRLLCFNIKNGNKIWDVRSVSSFIKSQGFLSLSVSPNGNVVMLNSSGDLININSKNGRIQWYINTLSQSSLSDTNFLKFSNIAITSNELFFSTISSTYSFTLNNGYQNWKVDVGSATTPIIDSNNIFLVTNNGYFVNLDRASGKTIWSTDIFKILKKRKQKTKVIGFVLGSNKIYVLTMNGHLIICSADTGKVESFTKIAGKINSPPIISNGSLYVLTSNSKILGYR